MNPPGETAACVAGVLIGGRSRRMGQPKALLRHPSGRSFLEHAVSLARAATDEVVLLGAGRTIPPDLHAITVLPDAAPDAGPLAGLCTLLEYANPRWSLLLACDMPGLRLDVIHRLMAAIHADTDAVAFQNDTGTMHHACCALYHPRLLPVALHELHAGGRSLQQVLSSARIITLHADADEARQLANVNTPDDIASWCPDIR